MDSIEEFRKYGKQMVDFIADYHENIHNVPVIPDVKPGYMRSLVPDTAPDAPEDWDSVFKDINNVVMPGLTHWHSPHFHAYYPTANSYPALLGSMLSDAIGCIGFSWMASPACTELEMITMDWLVKMLGLPTFFLHSDPGKGGGVIQGSASESTLVSLLAAKAKILKKIKTDCDNDKPEDSSKLVAYCSQQAHSSVERAAMLGHVRIRLLDIDDKFSLRGNTLQETINKDRADGLVPFFVCATLGTTSVCSFDNIKELGEVSQKEGLWMHIDAAYAGSAFICPEYRYLLEGIENTDSFNFNAHKWLFVNFDCSVMFVKDASCLVETFMVDPLYLKHEHQNAIPDYRHWQLPLGRRFRSLKLWFVIKTCGVQGLQSHIRKQIGLAAEFKQMVECDQRFEIAADVNMGLVCFRYKGSNEFNEDLNCRINAAAKIHMTPSSVKGKFVLRFVVASRLTESVDVKFAWEEISKHVDILESELSVADESEK